MLQGNVFPDIASCVRVNVKNASVELFKKKKSNFGQITHIEIPHSFPDLTADI